MLGMVPTRSYITFITLILRVCFSTKNFITMMVAIMTDDHANPAGKIRRMPVLLKHYGWQLTGRLVSTCKRT